MSTNGIDGLISGIDTTALIDAMVAARSGPVQLLEQRRTDKTAQLTAWKAFEATLISLKVEANRLSDSKLWDSPLVNSSDEEILTATGDKNAVLDRYELFVAQLAQAHQIRSEGYTSEDDLVGTGTLSITVGDDTTVLTVEAGTAVEDLVEQINAEDLGATASLVRSVEGGVETYTMVLTADETGEENSLSVSSSLTGGTDPVFDTEIRAAQDAIIEFGGEGGFQLHSATNTFTDILDGVDVTVHRVQESGDPSVTLEVGRDTEKIETALATFVSQYNAVMEFANGQYRYDPEAGQRPPLLGNSTLTTITGDIRSRLFAGIGNLAGNSSFRSLLDIGFSSSSTGSLTLDADELTEALGSDFDSVADLFRLNATFDHEALELLDVPAGVDLGSRDLEIVIGQAATRATLTGDLFDLTAGGLTIDAANDTFKVEIDGVLSEELTLAHGTYTDGDTLARAIQDAIDGSEDLGALGVRVGFTAGAGTTGHLEFTSNKYGSGGSIKLLNTGGEFFNDLGLWDVRNVEHAGQDVTATIDGVAVTGKGRILSVSEDEIADLAGLEIRVLLDEGDAPLTVAASFTEGIARTMGRALDSITDANEGTLKRVEDTVQSMLDRYDRDLESKLEQLDSYRERLRRRYASLESRLGELQSQGNFITAQIGSLGGNFGIKS